ncbi:MAG: hypothetical protein IT198_12330 [Acidimicrobiia bacterium]|nr:hypothetical protein [Acidimicrobiia bacterium]
MQHRTSIAQFQARDRSYESVNRPLRGEEPMTAESAALVSDLRDAVRRRRLPVDVRVFRGVRNVERTCGMSREELTGLVGQQRQLRGFLSTTMDRRVALEEFAEPGRAPALLELVAPRGKAALWMPAVGDTDLAYQRELLFDHRTRIVIREVRDEDGLGVIVGEIVP